MGGCIDGVSYGPGYSGGGYYGGGDIMEATGEDM